MRVLVTGAAGFIGSHIALRIARERPADECVCVDNINDYYDTALKYARLRRLGFERPDAGRFCRSGIRPNLSFVKLDISDGTAVSALFEDGPFDLCLHMAAQAGVRYSLQNPDAYVSANIRGFLNLLEALRRRPARHLVYASSSSVYGLNTEQPFLETQPTERPASLYAVSKKTNELMAGVYARLHGTASTGLRFFTVYGPWGRPDMAPFLFTKAILEDRPLKVFNRGDLRRDFTFIDDIVEGVFRVMEHVPRAADGGAGAALYNIGNGAPVGLRDFIRTLETALGRKAILEDAPMQPGDVKETWAGCAALERLTGWRPATPLADGVAAFVRWYETFYKNGV